MKYYKFLHKKVMDEFGEIYIGLLCLNKLKDGLTG